MFYIILILIFDLISNFDSPFFLQRFQQIWYRIFKENQTDVKRSEYLPNQGLYS